MAADPEPVGVDATAVHDVDPDAGATVGAASWPASLLGGAVRPLTLDRFVDDRGTLTPLVLAELSFAVARVFVVSAPAGAVRGGHAHRSVRQVLFRASGSVEVEFRHRGESSRLTLDDARPAVLVEAGVWAQQTYLDDGSTLIVLADGGYDRSEYLDHDHGTDGDAS
ncbi:sugar 3,4-ketoisomerase [Agromyces binzhouensis]|uniref:sugar 3,4-ketoisomerase n=1 Tax=Agromyces binzhouensis TaxID=1817495 RepID=UPI003624DDCD